MSTPLDTLRRDVETNLACSSDSIMQREYEAQLAALSDVQALLDAARHILAHGQLGKQSERRLRGALARFDSKDTAA